MEREDRKMSKRAVRREAGNPIAESEKSGDEEGNMATTMTVEKH